LVSISDLGKYIGSGSQGSVWQHASEPDKIIKIMKGFPLLKDGEMDAFQYDRYLERRMGATQWARDHDKWMFPPMANKMVLYLFRETMAMRKDNVSLPTGQVKVYAVDNQIFELKDMRRLYKTIVNNGQFGEASEEAQQFKRDWLTILSPGHRHGYLMVQEKLDRIGGRSRAQGQERPKVFEEWSTFLWSDFGLVTRDTKNPGNYGFRNNKDLVIYDPVVAPLPEQNDWSSRNVFNRLRYAYFVYLFTDIPKINDIDEHDAHEVNKIIRRFEKQIIAGNFYRIERQAEGFPGSYQPEPSLNDYGLRDIMYSGTASDNFQQTLANFGSEVDFEEEIKWDEKKPAPDWQDDIEWESETFNATPKQPKVKFPRAKADKIVATVEAQIKPYVEKMMACGSYRRGAQMIGDIDFVVILKDGYTLPQILPPNQGINWVGEQKAQIIIDGEKVDFRVTTPEAWGATILYFTGPADFNIKYRWMAKRRGLKLSEYGLFNRESDEYLAGATEEDVFTALGRPYREPDKRQGFSKSKKKTTKKAEEIRCCKECDKTTGLTTIQTGTYCYDCLPINLGAEDNYEQLGVALLANPESSEGWGVVYFKQTSEGVEIQYAIRGLDEGLHGFHIHEYGDLTDGCQSACAHFNPDNQVHGSLTSEERHFGDLGNIETVVDDYYSDLTNGKLFLPKAKLDTSKYGILGRMVIVHKDQDDLGQGGNEESLKTGNAGERQFCGVIGLADPKEFGSLLNHSAFSAEEVLLHPLGGWDRQIDLLEEFPNAKNFDALLNHSGYDTPIRANSLDEMLELWQNAQHGYNGPIYYINFPLNVYRGVWTKGDAKQWTWQRWLEDDKMGTSQNMGIEDTQPATLHIQEAFDYAGARSHEDRSGFELYSIDIQDYFVMFPRPSQPYYHHNCNPVYRDDAWGMIDRHPRNFVSCDNPQHVDTPVIFILGGARYEDLNVIWDSDANYASFDAEDNYDATYGVEQAKIRRKLKNSIKKQNTHGTKAGQWSARKSQLLKQKYEAACERKGLRAYKGKKTESQDNLSKWSRQKWGTGSGKKSSTTGEAYFPAKAVEALKKKGLYAKATRQKRAATKSGKQRATYSKDIQQVVADYRAEDQHPICPICDGYIPNDERPGAYPGAISRYDNETEVCSACGTTEGVGMMILGNEINVLAEEAKEFTDDPWEIWRYIIANAKEQLPPIFLGRAP